MATITPVAFHTGSTIPGTTQIGNLSVGTTTQDYGVVGANNGIVYYSTPDQDLGYVIAHDDLSGGHLGKPGNIPAKVGFWRSQALTENSFVELVNGLFNQSFSNGTQAKNYLETNGYWTSWDGAPTSVVYYRGTEGAGANYWIYYSINGGSYSILSTFSGIPPTYSSVQLNVNLNINDILRFYVIESPFSGNRGNVEFGGGFNGLFTGNCGPSNPYIYNVTAGQNNIYLNINIVSGSLVPCF